MEREGLKLIDLNLSLSVSAFSQIKKLRQWLHALEKKEYS
jgi:hypothetical protein